MCSLKTRLGFLPFLFGIFEVVSLFSYQGSFLVFQGFAVLFVFCSVPRQQKELYHRHIVMSTLFLKKFSLSVNALFLGIPGHVKQTDACSAFKKLVTAKTFPRGSSECEE